MATVMDDHHNTVYFEAAIKPENGASMFGEAPARTAEDIDRLAPPRGRATMAANALQQRGFVVRHVGTYSISAEGTRSLWEQTFGTEVEERTHHLRTMGEPENTHGQVSYLAHKQNTPFDVPEDLSPHIERAYPQAPPLFFESPVPPPIPYLHLRAPDDLAMILRAGAVHELGVTGRGVLVAMPDTGFYKHPYYTWHKFNYNPTLAPDATRLEHDEYGHGTAEAANVFACGRDADLVGVKMGGNPVLAFKAASDLYPAVMTNSWGYHLPNLTTLPNFLRPLEMAVLEAVRARGITVCFSGGNGHVAFPAMMPDVIAVGGVHTDLTMSGTDFKLEASDYASSFDSLIYAGRHVPDVCGLVGLQPRAIYIALPTEPGNVIDTGLAGGNYPSADQTTPDDGWCVISGTSAASPQVAGVCALLKQAQPTLSPDLVKAILKSSARDVLDGKSNMGEPAGDGVDGATGYGLVDAEAAYRIARSIKPRDLFTVPSPR